MSETDKVAATLLDIENFFCELGLAYSQKVKTYETRHPSVAWAHFKYPEGYRGGGTALVTVSLGGIVHAQSMLLSMRPVPAPLPEIPKTVIPASH